MDLNELNNYRKFWSDYTRYQDTLALLHWDSEVMMPEQGRNERSEQIALLSSHIHKMYTSKQFDDYIGEVKLRIPRLDPSSIQSQHLIKEIEVLEKERNRSKKLPVELVEEFSRVTNQAHGVWASAKKNKNFAEFKESLKRIVELSKETAECYGYKDERYNGLLEGYEPDTKAGDLEELFKHLKNSLIPIVQEGKSYPNPFKSSVSTEYQTILNKKLPEILGLSQDVSRLDISLHPFSTSLGSKDKRITTRIQETDPLSSIFSVLHETGHALYEYGLGTMTEFPSPISQALSYGIHESQSRLWENQIGRSRAFWNYFYPIMLKDFQIYHYDLPFDDFFKYVNSVQKTKIRVESDQVTYNLHIILRFEIERELISGNLEVEELPSIWNEKMKEFFDLKIDNDAEGVLQDVHWSGGSFGYFPTYTLGNIYSAQLFHGFFATHNNFWDDLEKRGDFSSLHKWLKINVWHQGKLRSPRELIKEATGANPDSSYLVKYLKSKVQEQD
jgi:carboxypeptidase Taq